MGLGVPVCRSVGPPVSCWSVRSPRVRRLQGPGEAAAGPSRKQNTGLSDLVGAGGVAPHPHAPPAPLPDPRVHGRPGAHRWGLPANFPPTQEGLARRGWSEASSPQLDHSRRCGAGGGSRTPLSSGYSTRRSPKWGLTNTHCRWGSVAARSDGGSRGGLLLLIAVSGDHTSATLALCLACLVVFDSVPVTASRLS